MRDGAYNALTQLKHIAAHPAGALIMLARCLTSLTGGWLAELSTYDGGRMSAGIWQALTPLMLVWAALGDGSALPTAQRRSLLITAALTVCGMILFCIWRGRISVGGPALGYTGTLFHTGLRDPPARAGRPRERWSARCRACWVMAAHGCLYDAAMTAYIY